MRNIFGTDTVMIVARILAFATAIPFHEAAHAFVSDKLGDPTARNLGRLSLNPIKHLDPWGLLAMLTIGIGWAKPVPVNPSGYKNKRVGMALTALAGPVSNLLLAFINMLVYKMVYFGYAYHMLTNNIQQQAGWVMVALNIFFYLSLINISLAVFNMLPVPPFDGSRIFGLVLPEKLYFGVMKYERYFMFAMLILLYFGVFNGLLGSLNEGAMKVLDWSTGFVGIIFSKLAPGVAM